MAATPGYPASDPEAAPLLTRPDLANATWYGSGLMSLLAAPAATGGRYALVRVRLQRAFTPPPHRHGPEAFYILSGRVRFDIAEEEFVATPGDFVNVPPGTWHTFTVESDEAEYLLIAAPPGLEQLFWRAGRPAEALELPGGRVGPPDLALIRAVSAELGIELAPPGSSARALSQQP
jgi:quercetin dioxygenase-like cupin family protein